MGGGIWKLGFWCKTIIILDFGRLQYYYDLLLWINAMDKKKV